MTPGTGTEYHSLIYLNGDSSPFATSMLPEQVIDRMNESLLALNGHPGALILIAIPTRAGNAYVRPEAISAISPYDVITDDTDSDDDEA